MQEIFDTYLETFGEGKQLKAKLKIFEYNYKEYFPNNKNAKLLDVGIGFGEMLSCMKNWGYENYFGIDISSSTVEYCKSIGLNCQKVEDTTFWLKEHKNEFELITLLDVLEHIKKEDVIELLKVLKEALTDDGVLIVQVPNLQFPDNQMMRYGDITHEVGYTEKSLNQVLITSGFKNIYFGGFETLLFGNFLKYIRKLCRFFYWKWITFTRVICGNECPKILTLVLFATAKK